MVDKSLLERLYGEKKFSAAQIAKQLSCSVGQVNYWLGKYRIKKRSISAAIYAKRNPGGDPFTMRRPKNIEEAFLYGLGIGLYWGEGTKRNTHSVRLGNSDPFLIKKFCEFLERIFGVQKSKLHFGLQIFGDMDKRVVLRFWTKILKVSPAQFYKIIVTPHRGIGNYRRKTKYGVLTVYFNNKKLRDIICSAIEEQTTI